jgi:hypothetical protein
MWAYLGSTSPDHPSSEELSAVEMETQIRSVLDITAVPPPGAGPDPLRRGITSVRVVPQVLFLPLLQFFLFIALMILCMATGIAMVTRGTLISLWPPQGGQRAALLMGLQGCVERERDQCTTCWAVRKWGMRTLTKSASSGEGETDQGATSPPLSRTSVSSSQSWGVGSWQMGPLDGKHRSKHF